MNGRQAAKAVHDLCIERQHNRSPVNPDAFILCERCRDVMNRLEKIGAEERPIPPTVTVHFVIGRNGIVETTHDEAKAHEIARVMKAMVVSWPVSADYREEKADASPARDD